MNPAILNREFQHPADGWYHIEPKGEHLNQESGVMQVIDDDAIKNIANRFNADAAAGKLSHGHEMLIDHEHFKHQLDKETKAYGWLTELQGRPDGIYGRIDWTGTGRPSVDSGDYRFFSTEYDPDDLVVLNGGNPPTVRPLRLDGLTLTNSPNNKGGRPITNREYFGSHKTREAWEADAEENRKQIAANIRAENETQAQREKSSSNEKLQFALPDLEKWFRAVKNIQSIALQHGGAKMSFDWAWAKAREQHPDIYRAAFPEEFAVKDAKSAADVVGKLANRISNKSGKSFHDSWNFVRENLPVIFNRMASNGQSVICNRSVETDQTMAVEWAAKLVMNLAGAETAISRVSLSQGMQIVTNRHPGIARLAKGQTTFAAAALIEPDIKSLI